MAESQVEKQIRVLVFSAKFKVQSVKCIFNF